MKISVYTAHLFVRLAPQVASVVYAYEIRHWLGSDGTVVTL